MSAEEQALEIAGLARLKSIIESYKDGDTVCVVIEHKGNVSSYSVGKMGQFEASQLLVKAGFRMANLLNG